MTSPQPPMYYDYGGFPPEAYTITWPAPGNPALAERVVQLLGDAGIPAKTDARRGFDHGTFVPFKLSWPDADVPTIQLSLKAGLDPREHLAIGRALAPLRDEGVLILGSGMSYHNMRDFGTTTAHQRLARLRRLAQGGRHGRPRDPRASPRRLGLRAGRAACAPARRAPPPTDGHRGGGGR